MRPILIGNWKMHGDGGALGVIRTIADTARAHPGVDLALCLPATLIHRAAALCPDLPIGGQDCHAAESGAYTGDIAASMLRDAGARLVILGHSERRRDHGESSAQVAAKARAAQSAGLRVVLCVGEKDDTGASPEAVTAVGEQMMRSLDGVGHTGLVVAYEPVWSIGTGAVPLAAHIATMIDALQRRLTIAGTPTTPVIYGGSVTPGSISSLYDAPRLDGILVGQSSMNVEALTMLCGYLTR